MIAKLLSLTEIWDILRDKGSAILKYVRVGDEYRFVLGGAAEGPQHKDMLDPGDEVVSAAFCIVDAKKCDVRTMSESFTLHLGPAPDDAMRLTARFFGTGLYKPESGSIMPM